jgi:hypothetical protein
MQISNFLGKHVSSMLETEPFSQWSVERSLEEDQDQPIFQYVFDGHAMALQCDRYDRISIIFLRADNHNALDKDLFEIPFDWSRGMVLNRFGNPSKSGANVTHPILGEYGAWDRFSRPNYVIHFEYRTDRDAIKRITLMRNDAVPRP